MSNTSTPRRNGRFPVKQVGEPLEIREPHKKNAAEKG
jgi:hypothetical protein